MAQHAILRRAIVLFAHGSRDPDWARPFQQLAIEMGEQPEVIAAIARVVAGR